MEDIAAAADQAAGLDTLLTPAQVSTYLGVPLGTLANWRYLGRGPRFVHVGRHVRYPKAELAAWLAPRLIARRKVR